MTKQSVFLDTSFLIPSQVEGHAFMHRTTELRRLFRTNNYALCISPLVLDEFWYVLLGIWRTVETNTRPAKLHIELRKATNNILSFDNIRLINPKLDRVDIQKTLRLMVKYKLRPRDARIVCIMKKEGIRKIASFDNDFDGVSGIEVVC